MADNEAASETKTESEIAAWRMLKACSLTLESKDERIAELERENARLNEYEMVCEPCNAPYLGRRFSATSEGFSKCPTCGSFGVPKEIIDRQKLVSERDSALARVKELELAIRDVWPHLTGHCFEGATPGCFGRMRYVLSAAVTGLPYADSYTDELKAQS